MAVRLPIPVRRPGDVAPLDLRQIRTADVLTSLREMVSLLRHGIDRQRVFVALGASTSNPVLAEVLQNIGQRTQSGSSLYQAMAAWPGLFDEVVQHLVRHGEGENRLAESVKAVHSYLEYKAAMQSLLNSLPNLPAAWGREARESVASARLLAALAVAEQVGLARDDGVPLAARQCGDEPLASQVLTAWEAASTWPGGTLPDQGLKQTLLSAGVVREADWQKAAQKMPNADMTAQLQALALQQSVRASSSVDQLTQRVHWGRRLAWRSAMLAAVALAWFFLTR